MAKKKAFQLVVVEWEDHSGTDGWMPIDEVARLNDHAYTARTVGWLIAEGKQRITLAASITAADDPDKPGRDVAGHMTINRKLIRRMRRVPGYGA